MQLKGFALLSAIILIVLLSGVAMFLAKVLSNSQSSSQTAYLVAQTYQAANSAIEWGIYHAMLPTPLCDYRDRELDLEDDFTVKITCSTTAYPGEGDVMAILAVASYGQIGKPNHVTRKLQVYVAQPPA